MQTLTVVFVVSLALLIPSGRSDSELIGYVCEKTSDFGLCEVTLILDPRSNTADMRGLIQILADSAKTRFTVALGDAQRLSQNSPPPALAKALEGCQKDFRFVLDTDIPEVGKALPFPSHPKQGEDAMYHAAEASRGCGDAVAGSGGDKDFIDDVKLLHDLSLVVSTALKILG